MGGCFSSPQPETGLRKTPVPAPAQSINTACQQQAPPNAEEQRSKADADEPCCPAGASQAEPAVSQPARVASPLAACNVQAHCAGPPQGTTAARSSDHGQSSTDSPTVGLSPAGSANLRGWGSANLSLMLAADQNLTVAELNQEIQDLAFIGQGASGDVYRGRWHSALVAVKYIVCQSLDAQEAATNEAALGRLLAHPNVVQTFSCKTAVIDDEFNNQMRECIEQEEHLLAELVRASNASLQANLGPFPVVPSGMQGTGAAVASPQAATAAETVERLQQILMQQQQLVAGQVTGAAGAQSMHAHEEHIQPPGDHFHSGEGFGSPVGQPQSMLAIQEVLLRADAKIGYSLTQIIMEYCDKGSLLQALEKGLFLPTSRWGARLALRAMLRTAQEVAQGMWHIHQCNVIHGDLKPGNVLLKSSRADRRGFVAKVADFGLSRISDKTTKDSKHWGTVYYMAPETFDGVLARQSDVYSFGITLWQMVTGGKPWPDLHPGQIILGVQSGSLTLEWPAHLPPRLIKLGEQCIKHDRKERPLFNHVMKELTQIENLVRLEGAAGGGTATLCQAASAPNSTHSECARPPVAFASGRLSAAAQPTSPLLLLPPQLSQQAIALLPAPATSAAAAPHCEQAQSAAHSLHTTLTGTPQPSHVTSIDTEYADVSAVQLVQSDRNTANSAVSGILCTQIDLAPPHAGCYLPAQSEAAAQASNPNAEPILPESVDLQQRLTALQQQMAASQAVQHGPSDKSAPSQACAPGACTCGACGNGLSPAPQTEQQSSAAADEASAGGAATVGSARGRGVRSHPGSASVVDACPAPAYRGVSAARSGSGPAAASRLGATVASAAGGTGPDGPVALYGSDSALALASALEAQMPTWTVVGPGSDQSVGRSQTMDSVSEQGSSNTRASLGAGSGNAGQVNRAHSAYSREVSDVSHNSELPPGGPASGPTSHRGSRVSSPEDSGAWQPADRQRSAGPAPVAETKPGAP